MKQYPAFYGPPAFEDSTSPLTRSNDGFLTVDRVEIGPERGWLVTATRNGEEEPLLFTYDRCLADAYIAGYDEHDRIT